MVDFVGGADAVVQTDEVADGSKDVVHGDGAADQHVMVAAQQFLLLLGIGGGIQDLADLGKGSTLVDAARLHVEAEEGLGIHAAVGDNDDRGGVFVLALHPDGDAGHAGGIDLGGLIVGDLLALGGQQFAGQRSDDVLGGAVAGNAAGQRQLLVHLEAAETSQVVAAGIKEQSVDVAAGVLHRRRFAGTQLAVAFQQAVLGVVGGILFQGSDDLGFHLAEELADLVIAAQAQGTQESGDRQLAVLVDADIEHVGGIGLVFQPGAAVGVHGRGEQVLAGTVFGRGIEHTGRTHELGNDNTLGAVGDEGAGIGHEGEITHEDFLVLHFAGLLVDQTGSHVQGRGIGGVALLAFLNSIFGVLVQTVINEFQDQVAGIVLNGGNVVEYLVQALFQEPVVRVFLDLDQIGHPDHFVDTGKAHSGRAAILYGLDLYHKMRPLLFR